MTERRAPVQGSGRTPLGSVAWWEHEAAWSDYNKRHRGQDAEEIAARGGFGYGEIVRLLGGEPVTWRQEPGEGVDRG